VLHYISEVFLTMTKPSDDKVVSIVGSAYFQPIADLLDDLLSRPKPTANDVKTSQREYGLACSISLLAVVCFESCAMRVRYLNRAVPAAQKRSALEFLRALYPNFPNIDELSEVFVLRDIIAHNHLWKIGFSWDDQPDMVLQSASKDSISGDTKYPLHVDTSTRKTKLLQLNAVPIKVDRSDALKLLKVVWNALLFLEQQDRNQCYVSHLTVLFKGKFPRFGDVVNSLP
jgi:hypothetical protein